MTIERTKKRKLLALLTVVIVATVLISASLSNVKLQVGLPFPGGDGDTVDSPAPTDAYHFVPVSRSLPKWISTVLWIILLSLLAGYLLYMIYRQPIFRQILIGVLILCVFIGLTAFLYGGKQSPGGVFILPDGSSSDLTRVGPVGRAPSIFVWLSIGGLILLAGMIGFWLYQTTFKAISTKNLIKAEAENAFQEIKDGKEWKNVVIRCYLQMAQVLQANQGIERETSMTTREFESVLISYKFPEMAVHRLTVLFEKVRYGNKMIESGDEQAAMDCLAAITGNVD